MTFYFGFCRSFLWPTFHNVIKARCFSQRVWRAYCTVNRKFADKAAAAPPLARPAPHAPATTRHRPPTTAAPSWIVLRLLLHARALPPRAPSPPPRRLVASSGD